MSNEPASVRWKDTVTAVTGVLGGVSGLLAAWGELREKIKATENLDPLTLAVAGGLLVAVAGYLQRERLQRRSRLLKPDSLRLRSEDHFVGRSDEVEALLQNCSEWPLIWLVGESGAGKSSLLLHGLLPRFRTDPHLLPIYVASWGVDWIEGPLQTLATLLTTSTVTSDKARDLGTIERHLREIARQGVAPIILFDQFDDYLARHMDRFRDSFSLLAPDLLASRNPFWRSIRDLLHEGVIRCLFASRSDTALSLESVRFIDPKIQYLERLLPGHALELLEKLAGEDVVQYPGSGFDQLKLILARDLEQNGRGLPIQMKVAFQGLRGLRHLTPRDYLQQGGLIGLEIGHVLRHLEAAGQFSCLEMATLRPILLALVNSATHKTEAKSEAELLALMPEGSRNLDKLRQALSHLEEKEVVRRALAPIDKSWQLDHDYLSGAVLALEEREGRWQKLLDESAQAFEQTAGPWATVKSLLPPVVQLRLLWERALSRLSYGNGRKLAIWSSPRLILNLAVILPLIALITLQEIRAQKVAGEIFDAFDTQGSPVDEVLSEGEVVALWQLPMQRDRVRDLLFERFFDSEENARRFTSQSGAIVYAAFGLQSPDLEFIDKIVGRATSEHWAAPRLDACTSLIEATGAADSVDSKQLAKAITLRMEEDPDARTLWALANLLGTFSATLDSETASKAVELLVKQMEQEKQRHPLFLSVEAQSKVLFVLLPKLKPEKFSEVYQRLVGLLGGSDQRLSREILPSLKAHGPRLDATQAFAVVRRLVNIALESSKARSESQARGVAILGAYVNVLEIGGIVEAISPKLNSREALLISERLVTQAEKTGSLLPLGGLNGGLGALLAKVEPQQSSSLADRWWEVRVRGGEEVISSYPRRDSRALAAFLDQQRAFALGRFLVDRIQHEEKPTVLANLTGMLADLDTKLNSQHVLITARRLTNQLLEETDPRAVASLARGLGYLGSKLDSRQATVAGQYLLDRIKQEANWESLALLAEGLADLGPRLDRRLCLAAVQRVMDQAERVKYPWPMVASANKLSPLDPILGEDSLKEVFLCKLLGVPGSNEAEKCVSAPTLLTTASVRWAAEDLLKWPTCSEDARVQILRQLVRLLGDGPAEVITKANGSKERINRPAVVKWLDAKGFDSKRAPRRDLGNMPICGRPPT